MSATATNSVGADQHSNNCVDHRQAEMGTHLLWRSTGVLCLLSNRLWLLHVQSLRSFYFSVLEFAVRVLNRRYINLEISKEERLLTI